MFKYTGTWIVNESRIMCTTYNTRTNWNDGYRNPLNFYYNFLVIHILIISYQIYNHININNISIHLFVIFFICAITINIVIIQLLWQPKIWKFLQLYNLPYLGQINASFVFQYEDIDNIVVQAWQLYGIILNTKIPRTSFGSD